MFELRFVFWFFWFFCCFYMQALWELGKQSGETLIKAHTSSYLCTCKLSLLFAVFALNHDKHVSEEWTLITQLTNRNTHIYILYYHWIIHNNNQIRLRAPPSVCLAIGRAGRSAWRPTVAPLRWNSSPGPLSSAGNLCLLLTCTCPASAMFRRRRRRWQRQRRHCMRQLATMLVQRAALRKQFNFYIFHSPPFVAARLPWCWQSDHACAVLSCAANCNILPLCTPLPLPSPPPPPPLLNCFANYENLFPHFSLWSVSANSYMHMHMAVCLCTLLLLRHVSATASFNFSSNGVAFSLIVFLYIYI